MLSFILLIRTLREFNEYSNKLIRQYIPKKSNFDNCSDKYISEINLIIK